VPDLSVDPETLVLSVINPSERTRSYFVTVDHPVRVRGEGGGVAGADIGGRLSEQGDETCDSDEDDDGDLTRNLVLVDHVPTTFVLVLRPSSIAELCQIVFPDEDEDRDEGEDDEDDDTDQGELRVTSDVKDLEPHPAPDGEDLGPTCMPLCSCDVMCCTRSLCSVTLSLRCPSQTFLPTATCLTSDGEDLGSTCMLLCSATTFA
jgi:hypothetical protein